MTSTHRHSEEDLPLQIAMIWAQTSEAVIGANNTIPWHYPEDMKHFRQITAGHIVVMGRETWESLPVRPLPQRTNIVLSTQPNYEAPGAVVLASVEQTLTWLSQHASKNHHSNHPENKEKTTVWVIGGATIYRAFMPYASTLEVTEIHRDISGDTLAPPISENFHCSERRTLTATDGTQLTFTTWRSQSTQVLAQTGTDETR